MKPFRILAGSMFAILRLSIHTRNPFLLFRTTIVCKGRLVIRGRIFGFRSAHIQIEDGAILELGTNIHASEFINIRASNSISLGENLRIAPYCIISDSTYQKLGSPCPSLNPGKIFIDKNCFLGPFTLICGSVIIGKSTIIGPHSNIRNLSIPPGTLYTRSAKK